MLPSVIGGPGGCFGLMAHTDTCVWRFARLAVPLGEGLHRGAVALKNQRSAQVKHERRCIYRPSPSTSHRWPRSAGPSRSIRYALPSGQSLRARSSMSWNPVIASVTTPGTTGQGRRPHALSAYSKENRAFKHFPRWFIDSASDIRIGEVKLLLRRRLARRDE